MRRTVRALAIGALHILIGAALAEEPTEYRDQLRFADGLFSRRMYALAVPEYEALLERFPGGARNDVAAFRLAESFRFINKLPQAARWYDRLVVDYPQSTYRLRSAYRRARLYMESGDLADAVEHFRAILSEQPEADVAAACLYYMGESLLELDRISEADATLELVTRRYADSLFAAFARMQQAELARRNWAAAREADQPDEADAAVARALKLYAEVLAGTSSDRLSAEALFRSADMLFARGDYDRSAGFYRRLLEQYPGDERAAESRLQAAWAAANAGLYAQALQLAEQAVTGTAGADRAEWLYLKANCERHLLQYAPAVDTYRQLLEMVPDGARRNRARYELALSLYKLGRYADAIREAGIIAGVETLQADSAWLLAESHAALNQAAEAIQFYRIVLRTAPDAPVARDAIYRLAYQLQQQGNDRESARFYTMLVERFPQDPLAPQALFAASLAQEKAGDDVAASRDWGRLAADYSDSRFAEEALFRKALADIRAGREREGGETLEQYLPRYPAGRFSADVFYWRGVLLSRGDRFRDAQTMLQQALALEPRLDLRREILLQLGTVQQKLRDDAGAAESFGQLLGSEAEQRLEPALLEWLASYHFGQDNHAAAIQAATVLTDRHPEPAWQQAGWALQARGHLRAGEPAAAEAALRKALEAGAHTRYGAEAALQLADLLLGDDRIADAERLYQEASRRAAGEDLLGIRVRALFGLGRSAAADDRAADAARYFMTVAILFDDPGIVPESLYRAAEMYAQADLSGDAESARRELLERYPDSPFARRLREGEDG